MSRIISENKKKEFIEACESIDRLNVTPDKLLKASKLQKELNRDEIEVDMLYKTGCPHHYIKNCTKNCSPGKGNPAVPKYCDECSQCWLMNITEETKDKKEPEVLEEEKERDLEEIIKTLKEYENTKITPSQLKEILVLLGWYDIYDFELLKETIIDLVSKKPRKI